MTNRNKSEALLWRVPPNIILFVTISDRGQTGDAQPLQKCKFVKADCGVGKSTLIIRFIQDTFVSNFNYFCLSDDSNKLSCIPYQGSGLWPNNWYSTNPTNSFVKSFTHISNRQLVSVRNQRVMLEVRDMTAQYVWASCGFIVSYGVDNTESFKHLQGLLYPETDNKNNLTFLIPRSSVCSLLRAHWVGRREAELVNLSLPLPSCSWIK